MEKLDKPENKKNINLKFDIKERSGKQVIKLEKFSLGFKEKNLLDNIDFNLYYKDKCCIIGENGVGKTSFIKEIIKNKKYIGSNVKLGYISQEINFDNINLTVLEEARKFFIGSEEYLRSALYKFIFIGENVHKKIKYLSGGEKVRLKLFCLIQDNYNLLILDEPTNHIDIDTREILENALIDYDGTVLFISHDRYFINKVANSVLEIRNNKIFKYLGNYDDYMREIKSIEYKK